MIQRVDGVGQLSVVGCQLSKEENAASRRVDRRGFIKGVVGAGGLLAGLNVAGAQAPTALPAAGKGALDAYAFGAYIWVRVDERVFTCYRAEPGQKYPYFYPVFGPASGLPMTDETALPWPHHRSLFLGCDRVNGGNYWQEGPERGQIVSRGPKIEKADAGEVIIADVCDWRQPGREPIIEDHRRFKMTVPSPDRRVIDADVTLTAKVDIQITKTNHSLFSVRVARDLAPLGGGSLIDAEGRVGEKATYGQTGPWCGFQGTRLGATESIVLMDHPSNPWSPCRWFTRDYGFMSPTPFNWLEEGWDLPAGKSVRVRYRVAVLQGEIRRDEISRLYADWAA